MQQDSDAPASPALGAAGWLGRLPRPCVLCSQWGRTGFCDACRQRFLARQTPRCPQCALPSPGGARCGHCLRTPPPFHHCITLADYAFPWDRLIGRFKFQQQPELARLLADALADVLQRAPGLPPVQWVLPVPLSPARLQARGYNQAWELARRVARRRGLHAQAHWLLRLRDTAHQVGLGRAARETNLRDAMWVPPDGQHGIGGCEVALVDDVMTTGGTAAAATRALLAAGAAGVQVWVLARTPAPGD